MRAPRVRVTRPCPGEHLLGHDLPSFLVNTAGRRNWAPRARTVSVPPGVLTGDTAATGRRGGGRAAGQGGDRPRPAWPVRIVKEKPESINEQPGSMTRAVVLSGGGRAGAAWMLGLAAGLRGGRRRPRRRRPHRRHLSRRPHRRAARHRRRGPVHRGLPPAQAASGEDLRQPAGLRCRRQAHPGRGRQSGRTPPGRSQASDRSARDSPPPPSAGRRSPLPSRYTPGPAHRSRSAPSTRTPVTGWYSMPAPAPA